MKDNKMKVINLEKHIQKMKNELSNPSPKHEGKLDSYREFVEREIRRTQRKIESLKLA